MIAWRILALLGLLSVAGCQSNLPAADARYSVSAGCNAAPRCHAQLQAALDAAERDQSGRWILIDVAPGQYREKVTVRRGRVHIRGAGLERTRLHFDAVAETSGHYHRRHWGTPGSATLTIDADEVVVEDIAVENTFDYLANDALPDGDPKKLGNSQAVALLLDIHSDRVSLERSALIGYQDTLFANGARALIRDSLISGNVDFIFGNGQVLIEDSIVQSRRRAVTGEAGVLQSFIVAPSTPKSQSMGIVIHRSRLTREPGVPDGSVALGRPWHPTTTFSDGRYADPDAIGQASFIDCTMDSHVSREGWTSMNGTARDGTKTAVFRPQDSRFSESGSRGPGARGRVDIGIQWRSTLTLAQMRHEFFEGWPQVGR